MKRKLAILIVTLLLLSLAACGDSGKKQSESSDMPSSKISNSSQESTPQPTDSPTPEPESSKETDSSKDSGSIPSGNLPEGLHIVGSDISEGEYLLTCTEATAWVLEVTVFESIDKYDSYFNADRLTGGEEYTAVVQNAFQRFALSEGEEYYISLKNGNVVLTEMGVGDLKNVDITEKIYPGIYFAGTDLENGQYKISADDSSFEVILFDNKESYMKYFSTDRFTGGEEDAAVADNASFNSYLYSGDTYIADLTGNQVLMIKENAGSISLISGDS